MDPLRPRAWIGDGHGVHDWPGTGRRRITAPRHVACELYGLGLLPTTSDLRINDMGVTDTTVSRAYGAG